VPNKTDKRLGGMLISVGKKIFDFFSSVKLAVILIASIGSFLAYGTFYESSHGTQMAQKLVYHGWLASLLMGLLIINLACAALDRFPWKKHHIGFVVTHLGIITMLIGAFLTQQKGLDGSVYIGINEKTKRFMTSDTELRVYQSLDEKPYVLLVNQAVDFDKKVPGTFSGSQRSNYEYKLVDNDILKVIQYIPFAAKEIKVGPSLDQKALPALKFKLSNPNVSVEEWVGLNEKLPPFFDFGPALVTFIKGPLVLPPQAKNQFVIYQEKPNEKLKYAVFSSKQKTPTQKGILENKKVIQTGWMNLVFEVEELFLNSEVDINYNSKNFEDPQTAPVIQLQIGDHKSWFELDSPHLIKGEKSSYFVSFVHKRFDLGFDLELKKFKMGHYQGSTLPSSYESTVAVNNEPALHTVSMNEPLKYKGLTLYQSSFENNDRGEPIASIFSVNYDPGRFVKYLGAIMMVSGIITMFYLKPRWSRIKK
jgi:hypothetical protein